MLKEIYIHLFIISSMNKYIFLLVLVVPAICQTTECVFPAAASLNSSCATINPNTGQCSACNTGYGLIIGQCYPPCPTGYTQLMPSYCLSNTVIAANTTFTLCTTNVTQLGGGQCYTPSNSTCTCGPPCPSGYSGVGCTCQFSGTSLAAEVDSTSAMYKFWTALFACAIALLIGFVGYKIWLRYRQDSTKELNTSGGDYKEMVTQRA